MREHSLNFVASVIALTCFCLGYAGGWALLILGSLAMHGPKPWYFVAMGGLAGSLAGGIVGMIALYRLRHRTRNFSRRAWTNFMGGWILWLAAGVSLSTFLDIEALAAFSSWAILLAPALMLLVTWLCLILPTADA